MLTIWTTEGRVFSSSLTQENMAKTVQEAGRYIFIEQINQSEHSKFSSLLCWFLLPAVPFLGFLKKPYTFWTRLKRNMFQKLFIYLLGMNSAVDSREFQW